MLAMAVSTALMAATPTFDGARISRDVKELASDAYEGRGPATAGEEKTIAYLSTQFAAAGLQPGGDLADGKRLWTQAVPLRRADIVGTPRITVQGSSAPQTLTQGKEIAIRAAMDGSSKVDIANAPLVFVGYGVKAPERDWDDFKGVDLKGKIAVVLINDPDFETGKGAFDGKGMTYYGRWTYKYEEAARRGAAGVLIVHETAPAAYGWATVQSSGLSPLFDIERSDADARAQHVPVRGWTQRALAESLFQRAGLDFEQAKQRAQQRDFAPIALGDARLSVDFKLKRERVVTHNVVGKLTGSQHPDETVIFSAHWDAFGVGKADASGDTIRRGAVDNATGVASVLELARVFAAGPRPQRTLYFIALTAEEKGLLGANYYAAHPLAPLDKTVAVLNMEMFSPNGPTRDIASWGRGRVSLEGDLEQAAKARGRTYSPDPNLEAGFFYRADHFAFARMGVPAITAGPGLDMLDGGVAAGKALRDTYFAQCYHQPCDRWTPQWDASGHAADTTLAYDVGVALANNRQWPSWQDGSEFKAIRSKSDAARK